MKTVDGDDIESDGTIGQRGTPGEINARSTNDFALLSEVDGTSGAAEAAVATVSNLHEDQAIALPGNDVNFAMPAVKISRQDF